MAERGEIEDRPNAPQYERFVQLFAQVHDNLLAYIFSLLPHWSDAEDVFQQTSLVLWRKFGEFQAAAEKGTGPIARHGPPAGTDAQRWSSHQLDQSPFPPNSDFLAWACRVAFYEVRNFRRVASRDRLQFGDALLEQLADERRVEPQRVNRRREFLIDCIAQLADEQRILLHRAYEGETTIRQLAAELHRSPQTLYNRLNLIRRALFECVEAAVERRGTKP
jgi:DNA-directed RNA polymerase specialized sigma24 family protein